MNTKRRRFLKNAGYLTSSLLLPAQWNFKNKSDSLILKLQELRDNKEEAYWAMVKDLFNIPKHKIMANAANLCPSPHFITEGIAEFNRALSKDVSFQYRTVFSELRTEALKKLSGYLHCPPSQIGITRNTSEANNIIVNGLDLNQKDEVLVWDQNHPSNLITWKQRAKRLGFKVRVIQTPVHPTSQDELLKHFTNAVNPRTRVIAFSHISNVSGIAIPAKELSHWAEERNILTLVDGAQTFGFQQLDLTDMGCSFYTASTHKWLLGPLENGILYIRREHQDKIWPNIIAAGWKEEFTTVDDRYCHLGQRHSPGTALLSDIIDFHLNLGPGKLENRIYQLNTHLKNKLEERIEGIQFITPRSEALSGGVTIFSVEGIESIELFNRLYSEYHIAGAPVNGVRISPTITTTLSDIDSIVEAISAIVTN